MSKSIYTTLIHGGKNIRTEALEVNVPVYLTSTFKQPSFEDRSGYGYARGNNPTREALENLIAELEGGVAGFAFASGMAATSAAVSLLNAGDKILVGGNIYGGTYGVFANVFSRFGITFEIEDPTNLETFEAKVTEDVKAIFLETPTNPTLQVADLRAIADIAHKKGILLIVDNTFSSPYIQRPLELGADVVVESATKYLGGHSDLIAGILAVKSPELAEKVHGIQALVGGIIQPFDAYLLIRSIKTLGVRLDRHVETAEKIADYLNGHEAVKKVNYPGLKSDPNYELQLSQAKNGGGMIAFELDEKYCVKKFLDSLKIFTLGASLGGVEALIGHPATSSHQGVPKELREKTGISDNLIRVSPGLEDADDLIADLEQAFNAAKK